MGHKFDLSKAKICHWRMTETHIFLQKQQQSAM